MCLFKIVAARNGCFYVCLLASGLVCELDHANIESLILTTLYLLFSRSPIQSFTSFTIS